MALDPAEVELAVLTAELGRLCARGTGCGTPDAALRRWVEQSGLDGILPSVAAAAYQDQWQRARVLVGELPVPLLENSEVALVSPLSTLRLPPTAMSRTTAPSSLVSPLSTLRLPDRPEALPARFVPAGSDCTTWKLDLDGRLSASVYDRLLTCLAADIRMLGGPLTADDLLEILERRAGYLPASPDAPAHADVPFLEQVKIIAALAGSFATPSEPDDVAETGQPFLLVGGDLSGIQDYLYSITSRGALKVLRGRSIFLDLLLAHTVDRILEPFGLSRAHVIMAAGGRFNLILPNRRRVVTHLESVRDSMERYLLDATEGQLVLEIAWVKVTDKPRDWSPKQIDPNEPTGPLAEAWKNLGGRLESQKSGRYRSWFGGDAGRLVSLFEPPDARHVARDEITRGLRRLGPIDDCGWCHQKATTAVELVAGGQRSHGCTAAGCLGRVGSDDVIGECRVCHRQGVVLPLPEKGDRAEDPVLACPLCRNLYHLGEHGGVVKEARCFTADPTTQQRALLSIEDRTYAFLTSTAWPSLRRLRFPFFPYDFDFGQPLDAIVSNGVGAARAGVLRMDVDDLGQLTHPRNLQPFSTIRIAAVHRFLNEFLGPRLQAMCQGRGETPVRMLARADARRRVVIIYAGGDDLFLVGHWLDSTELAYEIRTDLQRWCGGNPSVRLSAGLTVHPPGHPVYQMAQDAKRALQYVKDHDKEGIALFYPSPVFGVPTKGTGNQRMPWEPPNEVSALGFWNLLMEVTGGATDVDGVRERIPRALIRRLMEVVETRQTSGQLHLPQLIYALQRSGVKPSLMRKLRSAPAADLLGPLTTWLELLIQAGV